MGDEPLGGEADWRNGRKEATLIGKHIISESLAEAPPSTLKTLKDGFGWKSRLWLEKSTLTVIAASACC